MIPVFRPVYNTERILAELRPVFDAGWTGLGQKTEQFEKVIAVHLGARHCIALNSATAALHLAVKSLNLPRGSKVLTTPLTFISTNSVLLYEGLEPVFCDISKSMTGEIDIERVVETCSKHEIKAMMIVHYGGYPCDMVMLNAISERWGIPIIEDCAHAFGSRYYDDGESEPEYVGDSDNLCCFSFHAVKNLSIGDGGAITTHDSDKAEWFRRMRWMGIDKSTHARTHARTYAWEYQINDAGYKYHMNDIAATIGIENLAILPSQNARRAEIAEYYKKNLKGQHPQYEEHRKSCYHIYPVFVNDRDLVASQLQQNGVVCGMHYALNCDYAPFQKFTRIDDCRNARKFSEHEITLPMSPSLTDADVNKVVEVFNEYAY